MKMTRDEFDKLPLDEKIEYLQGTNLWEYINEDYNILRCDDQDYLDAEIDDFIEYNSSSWQDLFSGLSVIKDLLDNLHPKDWIYRDAYYGIADYRELTDSAFDDIVNIYKSNDAYEELFAIPDFDDVEGLL